MGCCGEKKEYVGRMRYWLLALIVAMFLPPAYADCPEPTVGNYPGWEERFSGNVNLGGNTSVENFDVIVEKIFPGNVIQVNVLRDSGQYVRASVSSISDGALKKPDILVELHNSSSTIANISVYTPHKANISANLTSIELLTIDSDIIKLLPGEVFRIDIEINNTGELGARDVHPIPQFGDFEIQDTDAVDIASMCPGSTRNIKYRLKAPDVRKAFNYTMYLQFDYIDGNIETGATNHRSTFYPFSVEISPALLEISRSSGTWTLKNPGRDIPVTVTLNNSGSEAAYNVLWSADLPPYVQVSKGTTSFEGRILEGKTKKFSYEMVSDDPIICNGISTLTYTDRYGNNYSSHSTNSSFRFSPFITIDKNINKYREYFNPIKTLFQGDVIRAIDEGEWWGDGDEDSNASGDVEITLNRTRNLTITVKIKNMGNAVARDLSVNDSVVGITINGTTSWNGDLHPGGEASYSYTAVSLNKRNISIDTNVSYLDVDPASFHPSIADLEGRPQVRYCTVTSKNIEFGSSEQLYAWAPELILNLSGPKVLAGSEFDFIFNITNIGSDTASDVLVQIDTKELKSGITYGGVILKGQSFYYLSELKPEVYPDGTERDWSPTNASFDLVLRAPDVETDESFNITATVNYTDFYGEVHSLNKSINISVVKALPAYEIVTLEKKNLTVTSGGPGEIDIDGYGEAFIRMKNTGFAELENITIKVKVPVGLELYSNDTAWHGRVVSELRRNTTWYGFEGEVEWNGSLVSGKEMTLPLLVRGKKAGIYDIEALLKFNAHNLSGLIPVKVKGAILDVSKSLGNPLINVDGSTIVTVTVTNIGEASAKFVKIIDHVPPEFDVIGETETEVEELKPGEQVIMTYTLLPQKVGSYTIKKVEIEWTDELGNEYAKKSSAASLEVVEEGPAPTVEPPVEKAPGMTRRQLAATALFAGVFLLIMFKFLTLSRPIKEE